MTTRKDLTRAEELALDFSESTLAHLAGLTQKINEADRENVDPNIVMLHTIALMNSKMIFFWDAQDRDKEATRKLLSELTEVYVKHLRDNLN